ncbi:MAG: hypothetical protein KA116_13365 [Proteobacteria bacterium]|jgi:predicted DNA binding CopG/RHH family protein|nr:hypothetical protein [Pseudomonadota bacterium]
MKDEYDFSKGKRVDPSRVDPNAGWIPINLRIYATEICAMRDEADRLGISYLTLMENIINQYAKDLAKDKK